MKKNLVIENLSGTSVTAWRRNAIQYLLTKPLDVKGGNPMSTESLITYSHMIYILSDASTDEALGYAKIEEKDGTKFIEEFEVFREYRKRGYGRVFVDLLTDMELFDDIEGVIDSAAIFWWKVLGSHHWYIIAENYVEDNEEEDQMYGVLCYCESRGHKDRMTNALLTLFELAPTIGFLYVDGEVLKVLDPGYDATIYGWSNFPELEPHTIYFTKKCIDALLSGNVDDIKLICESGVYKCLSFGECAHICVAYDHISNGGDISLITDSYINKEELSRVVKSIDRLCSIRYVQATLYVHEHKLGWVFSSSEEGSILSVPDIRVHRSVLKNDTPLWTKLSEMCYRSIHPEDMHKLMKSVPSEYIEIWCRGSDAQSKWLRNIVQ